MDRQTRLLITMSVGAAIMLLIGVGLGFALGRATAPAPEPEPEPEESLTSLEATLPSGVEEPVPDDVDEFELEAAEETTEADEPEADTTPPPRPRQLAPANGATIDGSRVYLKWSKVKDDSDAPVTYTFEIQDRLASGNYGNTQVIRDLKATSYSARVLGVRRRWRVWAVDEAGNASAKTGWWTYSKKVTVAPTSKPKSAPKPAPNPAPPSDETT
jgi:hypothetical protein